MNRIVSVVGARPNFMKIAPIVEEMRKFHEIEHCLIHSGQHYDDFLSASFFAELGLPKPDVNLQCGSGSHAVQTAEVMKRIEPVLLDYKPNMVLVVGDVNSTIAAALTAVKLGISVAHIEAGLRSFDKGMPEEINRKLTDAISDLLFITEQSGIDNLRREGVLTEKMFFVGNVMIDTLLRHREMAGRSKILETLAGGKLAQGKDGRYGPYGVMTLHRPSNVDNPDTLRGILEAVQAVAHNFPVFFPLHPRTRKNVDAFGFQEYLAESGAPQGIVPLDPLGYLDFLCLLDHARLVFTDSGGIQEETTVLGVPCLTLRENTERPATVDYGTNEIVGVNPASILRAAESAIARPMPEPRRPPLWDGQAAARIVAVLRQHLQSYAIP